jgi:hypothetical protein
MNNKSEKMWMDALAISFEVLSRHLPEAIEEIHENLQSEQQMSQLKFEASTSKQKLEVLRLGFFNDYSLISLHVSLINLALLVKGGSRYCWPFMTAHFGWQHLEVHLQQERSY